MPRNKKKKSAAPQNPTLSQLPRLPDTSAFTVTSESTSPSKDSSSITVHPSVYYGGYIASYVDCNSIGVKETFESIVCEKEYCRLSPEELRFLDLEINPDPALLDPNSFEEVRLQYYLDQGRTSVPQFGPPTPVLAFSVYSGVTPTSSEGVDAVAGSGSTYIGGCPVPRPTFDEKPAITICSLCAARLDADVQGCEEYEELGRHMPTPSISRHSNTRDLKKRSRISRRVHRLEKTVESLSHGLILALTELQNFQGLSTTADGRKTDNAGMADALSTASSGLSTIVDHLDSTRASVPDTTHHPSEQPDSTTQREGATKFESLFVSREPKLGPSAEPDSVVVGHTKEEIDSSLVIKDDRSPISGLLKPILDSMTCPEVFRFLKWAEAHPGLRSTKLFDLFWVADNLFNVHGGILIYCLQKSFIPMDAISGATDSSAWSQDTELMQKLDGTYRKHLRPHIDGSCNSVARAAWESYCFEIGGIFSEQFPDWESATPFFQVLSREYDCLGPMITPSYIEDVSALWIEVHPALLEVTRWLEPFIDYGPNYYRAIWLYDAPIALGRHARQLFNRRGGVKEPPTVSTMRVNNLMRLLCEHRSGDLKNMQREMESVMSSAVSRNFFDTASGAEVAALVDRAKNVTLWRVSEPHDAQMQDALARREVRVMKSYRPRLLRAGTAAARIRSEMFDVLVQTGRWEDAEGERMGEREVFWDGILLDQGDAGLGL